ncbi:MAG: hypothetical protein CMC15_16445 [Flavobacteriaceae bacterium]|nr:hypothetical protein [Flavobacteriaceae bacterium]
MTYEEFNKFRNEFIDYANKLSDQKSQEYTISNPDKHFNFKNVAARLGITPEQALMTYVLKHMDAMCNDAKTGKIVSDETVYERSVDIMNYMILYASLKQEQPQNHTPKGNKNENQNNLAQQDRTTNGNVYRHEPDAPKQEKYEQLKRQK